MSPARRNRELRVPSAGGLREQIGIAFVLVTLIPMLTTIYLVVRYVAPSASSPHHAFLIIALAVVLCGLGWLVVVGMAREVQRLASRAREVAGRPLEGPPQEVEGRPQDEISQLDQALMGIDETIRRQVELLTEKANQVRFLMRSLEVANEELAALHRMKSRIIRLATHEFRNPLQTVIETASLFEDGILGDLTDEQRRFINHISASGHSMERLVSQMIMLARIGENAERSHGEVHSAETILEEVVEGSRALARAYDCQVHAAAVTDGTPITGEKEDIVAALRGVLDSLIRHVRPGGRVEASLRTDSGFAQFSFSACPLEMSEEFFDRFIDSASAIEGDMEDWNGMAELELPLSKELLRLQGGSLAAHREGDRLHLAVVLPVSEFPPETESRIGTFSGGSRVC